MASSRMTCSQLFWRPLELRWWRYFPATSPHAAQREWILCAPSAGSESVALTALVADVPHRFQVPLAVGPKSDQRVGCFDARQSLNAARHQVRQSLVIPYARYGD